mmetsp:Transcript_17557/g.48165  ORF Transcript_17557/g.48165 Transcript_17557/m.48165 type:complete len:164 (-) Transcript_17557:110-601(-)
MAAGGGKFYGAERFNPRFICTQIVVMQCAFYMSIVSSTALANCAMGVPQSLSSIFVAQSYTWETTSGLVLTICEFWTALVMALALRHFIERAKKCLDFAATYQILHLVATVVNSGFPDEWHWWAIKASALAMTVVLGEWLCMQVETQAIKLSHAPSEVDFDDI